MFPLPNRSVKRSSSLRILSRFRKVSHPFVPMMGRKVSAAGKRMPEEIRPARLPLMKRGASHADSFSTEVGGVGLMRPPLGGRKLQNAACHLEEAAAFCEPAAPTKLMLCVCGAWRMQVQRFSSLFCRSCTMNHDPPGQVSGGDEASAEPLLGFCSGVSSPFDSMAVRQQ